MIRALLAIGGLTGISRILGFVRDLLLARLLGTGLASDAFLVALVLPNMFRKLFGEGAWSSAFVPVFTRILNQEGDGPARTFASASLTALTLILLGLLALFWSFPEQLIRLIAPGMHASPAKLALALDYVRITLPFLLLACLTAAFGAVLNGLGRFSAFAATPIWFNLVLILALLAGSVWADDVAALGTWAARGVLVSGFVQLAWIGWHCQRAGFVCLPRLDRSVLRHPGLRRQLALWWPSVLTQGMLQIQLVVGTALASTIGTGAVSWLYFADRVVQLPLGVVGVALGTFLLHGISAAQDPQLRTRSLVQGIGIALFCGIPMSAGLAILAEPIILTLFQRGALTPENATQIALALQAYAAGLPAFLLLKPLGAAFLARQDAKTPMRTALASLACYIACALVLLPSWGHVGLAAATSVACWLQVGVLAFLLRRNGMLVLPPSWGRTLAAMLGAALVMSGWVLLAARIGWPWTEGIEWRRVVMVFVLVSSGALVYPGIGQLLGLHAWAGIRAALRPPRNPGPAPGPH